MMAAKRKKILFYYLSAFSVTGGIEKFNRSFIKALNEVAGRDYDISIVSVYDDTCDDRYTDPTNFKGFAKNKARSLRHLIQTANGYDLVILGHINLAVAGLIVKALNAKCKTVLVAHGKEAWNKFGFAKKMCLKYIDTILAVSNFTKNQLVLNNGVAPSRIRLFPNTIDPLFAPPELQVKPDYLLTRYGISQDKKIIFTLSRLNSVERRKGYDQVIAALPSVLKVFPDTMYLLAGNYSINEKERLLRLIELSGVQDHVMLLGFIEDHEVIDHFQLADVFIMPSRKEGFGIVFLEALLCGTPAIGGNQDGSVEALRNGYLGQLINPTRQSEIITSILKQLSGEVFNNPLELQQHVIEEFGFPAYRKKLKDALEVLLN